jgi:hypothetical protein
MRLAWEGLNPRERTLALGFGSVLAFLVLAFPPYWIATQNTVIADENTALRDVLDTLSHRRAELVQLAGERRASEARFKNRTPSLGSFLEGEAQERGLTLQEVTDEPGKTAGRYLRRSARASIPDVGLTPVVELLASISTSQFPVAVDHVQLEHFQAGDKYSFKLGVVTFDRESDGASTSGASDKTPAAGAGKASR